MKTMTRVAALAAFAAVLGAAPAASALTVKTIFKGVVSDAGTDNSGLFGPALGDLSGEAFTAVYLTELTPASSFDYGVYSVAYGGADFTLPLLSSATLTINGHDYAISGAASSALMRWNDGASDSLNLSVSSQLLNYLSFGVSGNFLSTVDLASFVNYSPGGSIGEGVLELDDDYLTFSVTSVRSNGLVPEPATWALMLGGFGLTGAALLRRRAALPA